MATTTNLGLTKPTVGGDTDAWGGYLNNDLDYIDAMFSKVSTAVTFHVKNQNISGSSYKLDSIQLGDDRQLKFGDAPDYWFVYDNSNTCFELNSTNVDGGGTDGVVFKVDDGTDDVVFNGNISATQVDILAEGDLRLQDASGGQYVGFDAPATVSGSYTLTLPAAVGSSGQILRTSDASGTLEWVTDQEGDIKSVADATNGGLAVTNGTGPDVTLALDFNDLTAAAVSVANDSIAIIDANDSNATRKESIADLASAMGGTGLTGSSGTLNVDAAQTGITSVGTLSSLTVSGDLTVDTDTLKVNSSTNRVGVGTASPVAKLDVSTSADDGVDVLAWDTTQSQGANLRLGHSLNATVGAHTALTVNDVLGKLLFAGSDGTDFYDGAAIIADATQNYTGSNGGTRLEFWTTPSNSQSRAQAMTIDQDGSVGIGTTSPDGKLHVKDATNISMAAPAVGQFIVEGSGYTGAIALDGSNMSIYHTSSSRGLVLGTNETARLTIAGGGDITIAEDLAVTGALSKGSGSFKIDHPLPEMSDTHHLVHSFVEGPKADLIYRGSVALVDGAATVDLDAAATMTSGTWEVLCRDPQVWVQNEDGWTQVRGSISGSTLSIEAQDSDCTDTVSWLVVAERKDPNIVGAGWTDEEGRVIVEPVKGSESEPGDDGA